MMQFSRLVPLVAFLFVQAGSLVCAFVIEPAASSSALFRSQLEAHSESATPFFCDEISAHAPERPSRRRKQTLYQILGASRADSRAQIKRHYLKMAKQTHPDAALFSANTASITSSSAVTFHEVSSAWSVLSNERLRQQYDRGLKVKNVSEIIYGFAILFVRFLRGTVSKVQTAASFVASYFAERQLAEDVYV